MRSRDSLILAGILLIVGFAAADALRGDGGGETSGTKSKETSTAEAPTTVQGLPLGQLGGRLVFTGEACVIQELDLPSGTVFPLPRIAGTCKLWGPRRTERLAYSLRSRLRDVVPFRIVDLNHAARDYGEFRAQTGSVIWSLDGQRLAWCDTAGRGQELEFGAEIPRELAACPAAYTDTGELAYVQGRELRIGDRPALLSDGGISSVSFGENGSVAFAVAGRTLRVYRRSAAGGHLAPGGTLGIAPPLQGRPPVFSPDNCGAFFRTPSLDRTDRITVVDLGCLPSNGERSFAGHAAAWSPDGRWLAVAGDTAVTFHDLAGQRSTILFTARASDLIWKG